MGEVIINERIMIIDITYPCENYLSATLIYQNSRVHKQFKILFNTEKKQMKNCEKGWYITDKEGIEIWKIIERKLVNQ